MSLLQKFRRLSKWAQWLIITLVVLLVAARIALPYVVKWYANKKINEMPGYAGEIGEVSIHLWRGAYSIESIDINKTDGKVPVPFFASHVVDFSVEWRALFQGALVAKIEFDRPVINFVKGPSQGTSQVGVDKPWFDVIKQLVPLQINRFEVFDGSVHYRDFYSNPKVDLTIDEIHMLGTNLTNSLKLSKTLVANLEVTGRAFKTAPVELHAKINPSTKDPTFDLAAKLDPVPLSEVNDFAAAYAKFKFTKGKFSVASELAASDGKLTGYVKPLFDDIAIINLQDVKNPLQFTWESLMAGITRLFRNQPNDRLATKIPISGTFHDPKIGVLPAIGNILRNEFIRVYQGNIEGDVSLKDAAKTKP
ncbi:MAG: DUF748 domain-containing protein [Chthoniobacteraceae bacterium]